ncbi:MAG TPA: TIM barrel protein [Candidatus Hypogeohydataceae bacterium YC40]
MARPAIEDNARFGVAGCPPNFWKSPFKEDSANNPLWLDSIGLDAYEVQFTHGIRMDREKALRVAENARKGGISLSIHAPYFVVLTSLDDTVVKNSIDLMTRCIDFAQYLGTSRLVFHPGPHHGNPNEALKRCLKNLETVGRNIPKGVYIYPETIGRKEFLGTLEEVVKLCRELDFLRPCIDFAHVYARNGGNLVTPEDYIRVFDYIAQVIGKEVLSNLHCHFYPVEFDSKGEKCHRNFKESASGGYGPRFEPFLQAIVEYNLSPTIICESKQVQDEDALTMKRYYEVIRNKKGWKLVNAT